MVAEREAHWGTDEAQHMHTLPCSYMPTMRSVPLPACRASCSAPAPALAQRRQQQAAAAAALRSSISGASLHK